MIGIMGFMFFGIFSKVGILFRNSQQIIDRLNKTINESILGSTLIRVLHGQSEEKEKFTVVNTEAKENGLKILRVFSGMIPLITFISSLATLVILSSAGDFHEMKTGGIIVCSTLVALVYIPEYSYGRSVTHT
jgi:ATP-binding cassette subfamily B protein